METSKKIKDDMETKQTRKTTSKKNGRRPTTKWKLKTTYHTVKLLRHLQTTQEADLSIVVVLVQASQACA
jgi:hypothetical protein